MAKGKKKNKPKVQQQSAAKPGLSSNSERVINDGVKATAIASAIPAVLMKVCRLCGAKEGPFLNIFDQDQVTAIKIDQLMPFKIEENDDLPHKICFRCSAKLEELHEFVSKCVNTQWNLNETMGKKEPTVSKTNTRQMWEDKLNKSNMTNEDICNALIKKAMEGIKDIPHSPSPEKEEPIVVPKRELRHIDRPGPLSKKEIKNNDEDNNIQLKEVKLALDKCDKVIKRPTRLKTVEKPAETPVEKKVRPTREATKPVIQESSSSEEDEVKEEPKEAPKITNLSFDFDEGPFDDKKKIVKETAKKTKPALNKKSFNIMDHVCMIKVNGVGVLFQCKLCNRNFLKREVVLTHSCAKNGVAKVDFSKNLPPPEPAKIATVKYINTKVDDSKKVPDKEVVKPPEVKTEVKPKPRIGPASRVKQKKSDTVEKDLNSSEDVDLAKPRPIVSAPAPVPTINFPSLPGLNGRYRLVPGPNNSFTLLEDSSTSNNIVNPSTSSQNNVASHTVNSAYSGSIPPQNVNTNKEENKKSKKRKFNNPAQESLPIEHPDNPTNLEMRSDTGNVSYTARSSVQQSASDMHSQPYPVGLFQTMPRAAEPPAFTTPAMKKQSYTVVQTGNPSKLLISTKPLAPVEEVPPKKKQKKPKASKRSDEESQEPFNVTLEDASHPKDSGFFTFINVDPLLQPSYVLPTDNIIQESQISTSTAVKSATAVNKEKDKYPCNMCNEAFTREKKLLSHIQSHYSKMDEEDQIRAERTESRRKSRK